MRLLKVNEVIETVQISRSRIYRMIAAGDFPAPVKIGPKSIRFRDSDVDEWLESLSTHSDLVKDRK